MPSHKNFFYFFVVIDTQKSGIFFQLSASMFLLRLKISFSYSCLAANFPVVRKPGARGKSGAENSMFLADFQV
jgi:hypothetical protein